MTRSSASASARSNEPSRGALRRLQSARSRRRARRNPTGEMTLVEHLQELRTRIVWALLFIVCGTVIGFMWYEQAPFGWAPLGEVLRGPYCQLPPEQRASFTPDGECRLLATAPFEMFMLRLKVGALAGLVISSPLWLYQLWAFITPGLHKNERRWTYVFVSLAAILFVAGAVLAYFILSIGLSFLLTMGEEFQVTALSGGSYYNFMLALLCIFGVSFEVPLIIAMLNVVGILEYEAVKGKRRIIAVTIMIFAAFMTPGQDPFSMVVLSAAIWVLVEIAFQFCRINDARRAKQRPDWLDVDDESATPVDSAAPVGSAGLEAPSQVARPEPIAPADFAGPSAPAVPAASVAPLADAPQAQTPQNAPAQSAARPSPGIFDDVL